MFDMLEALQFCFSSVIFQDELVCSRSVPLFAMLELLQNHRTGLTLHRYDVFMAWSLYPCTFGRLLRQYVAHMQTRWQNVGKFPYWGTVQPKTSQAQAGRFTWNGVLTRSQWVSIGLRIYLCSGVCSPMACFSLSSKSWNTNIHIAPYSWVVTNSSVSIYTYLSFPFACVLHDLVSVYLLFFISLLVRYSGGSRDSLLFVMLL